MEIENELFRRIAGDVPLQLPTGDPGERRVEGRVWLGRHAHIVRPNEAPGESVGVVVRDLSRRGVGLLCSRAVETGDAFLLVLAVTALAAADGERGGGGGGDEAELPWITLECRTLRCDADAAAGVFIIGAAFERVVEG